MLSLEEYMTRRKKEDQLNEFDLKARMDNMRICVNYVFEYFNQYLDISKMDEKTILNNERIEKYKKQLSKYEPELQEWLVNIYDTYDKQLNRTLNSFIKKDELFLLYHEDSEFRSMSYECYAHLIKKNAFLKEQTEMLFLFIKDYHRIQSQPMADFPIIFISEEINQWILKTWKKFNVNILAFAFDWVVRFEGSIELWEAKHKIKNNNDLLKYDYDYKQKKNLFNINSLYARISNKPFIRGKKQYLEILLMYYWLHDIVGDQDYWQEYINKTINN